MAILEPLPRPLPGLKECLAGVDRHNLVNALVAWLFAISGPVVIILAVGRQGGLAPGDLSSWVFAAFGFGGLLTMSYSYLFRQPIAIMWTIPGAVLVGGALPHLTFAEVIGAYLVCGVLLAFLGVTGLVRKIMAAIPMPIVMAMVAGVFLPFGLNIIKAFDEATVMAIVMVAAFAIPTALPRLGRVLPPVLCALAAGTAAIIFSGQMTGVEIPSLAIAEPILYTPVFTLRALGELVVPLAVTVIAAQNAQGFVILRQAGFEPPENSLTVTCGLGSLVFGIFGSVPTCVTGPANAILNTSGAKERRYMAGVLFG
ncbi:MAG: benzoate transporter, partial [Rhodospirillaceae bacterium]|nr:benzoate transporter [Rhodospirillaceae bacterium]